MTQHEPDHAPQPHHQVEGGQDDPDGVHGRLQLTTTSSQHQAQHLDMRDPQHRAKYGKMVLILFTIISVMVLYSVCLAIHLDTTFFFASSCAVSMYPLGLKYLHFLKHAKHHILSFIISFNIFIGHNTSNNTFYDRL